MLLTKAISSKLSLSQLQAGQEPFALKNKLPPKVGGIEDFLSELNQATSLRLMLLEDTAADGRLKIKKTPGAKDLKIDPGLQKQEDISINPANIADSARPSDPVMAKIMAALEKLNQQNQASTVSLLSNWGDSSGSKSTLQQQAFQVQSLQNTNPDLEALRANLRNLGLESMLGDLEKAKASGNLEQMVSIQANLAQKLLAQIAGLQSNLDQRAASDTTLAQKLLAQIASLDAKAIINTNETSNPALQKHIEPVRVIAVSSEPSLPQELKSKQAANLNSEFTSTNNGVLGQKTMELLPSSKNTPVVKDLVDLGASKNLLASQASVNSNLSKVEKMKDLQSEGFSDHQVSAPQVAPSTNSLSTPTQIALSLQETSITSGPLHNEIISAAKLGGGRIQLELTPPEQGTLRIDLRIDHSGKAYLIVEGANDAAKARLDHGGQQLKNEFAQMGLNLSLDLRQGDGRFTQSQQFGSDQPQFTKPNSYTDRSAMGIGLSSEKFATTRFLSDSASGISGIHLYA
jgi:hypothetical protein